MLLVSPLVLAAPQYGGNSFQGSNSAPAHSQSQSVQCRTENQVVWDTKYVQTETQVGNEDDFQLLLGLSPTSQYLIQATELLSSLRQIFSQREVNWF